MSRYWTLLELNKNTTTLFSHLILLQTAQRAAEKLQRAKEEAEMRRLEREAAEKARLQREAEEAAERAAYADALTSRRTELEVELGLLMSDIERLTASMDQIESERAAERDTFFAEYQTATHEEEAARKAADRAKQSRGAAELLIIQEKLAEKEVVQRILANQKAETEAAHNLCQTKLRELAEHEQVQ